MQYRIEFIGHTWGGFEAASSETVYCALEDITPERVKSIAGDFESVTDYRVIQVTENWEVLGSKRFYTREEVIQQPFDFDDSEELFNAATNEEYDL